MKERTPLPNKIFLDASFAIALSSKKDQYHKAALGLAEMIEKDNGYLITTRAVVLEIGNALAKLRYRNEAFELLNSLEADPNVDIVPITEELYKRALKLYGERKDKEWGMTDCISFTVMQENGLEQALTTDLHFEQAGFYVLLKES
ncbi:MAG: PIN domain-containing protein [bacterium]